MSQISNSEIEYIMIEIQRINLNEIKEVNSIGRVGGPSKMRETSVSLEKSRQNEGIRLKP